MAAKSESDHCFGKPQVIFRGEVLEIRNVEGVLHIARKVRYDDEWDPKVEPYDPYGPGDEFVDD
jgi:hypothetical protein